MCGIVGAVAQRDVEHILLEGLKRLEYRGYDSAGLAVIAATQKLQRCRALGKVRELETALQAQPLRGSIGIAHTRWATHGQPSENNAHPHMSHDMLAVVHNGIVENHEVLRAELIKQGYEFQSQTDTEVVAHFAHWYLQQGKDFTQAVTATVARLEGNFSLAFISETDPDQLIAVCHGAPLVIGLGLKENFIASDRLALAPVTQRFIYLEEGDLAILTRTAVNIYDKNGQVVVRQEQTGEIETDLTTRGGYRHYMQKEIFAQPRAVTATWEGRVTHQGVLTQAFGQAAAAIFDRIERVQIVACGTSYHAGLVARHWLEGLAQLPCQVEVASEIRYRHKVVEPNTLFVALSQSGETADTLAALRAAKSAGYLATLAICNVATSSLVREADLNLLTLAGPEIGVASTKAFTTQLIALLLLTAVLGRRCGQAQLEHNLVVRLAQLSIQLDQALALDSQIQTLARLFAHKQHALFLGRGIHYPIALEGALKLKEISYIHAEAYPAGELKHGPLALVDKAMPVIALVPSDQLLDKLKSNLQEVRARGGQLILFAAPHVGVDNGPGITSITLPAVEELFSPLIYTIPLQLLAYHVAVLKGTDVDQPRNLAKSVTVE